MKNKMLMVIPPCFLNRNIDFEIGLPIHLAYLGRVIVEQGWDVDYIDMTLEEKEGYDSFSELINRLNNSAIKLVGISNHTVRTSITTKAVAEKIKELRPDIKVIVGGVNATFMWRELLESCSSIDYIIRGYGQPALRTFLATFQDNNSHSVPGLVSRRNGNYNVEPIAPLTSADISTPPFQNLEVKRYLEWTKTYPLLTHTGCNFSCNFCTSVMPSPHQNHEVYRPCDNVLEEMQCAIEMGFNNFFMSANTFTSNRDYCMELCNKMKHMDIAGQASWVCMTRVGSIDKELLYEMQAAGCYNVAFGIEVASSNQWKELKKGTFSKHTILKTFSMMKEIGIGTTAYILLGTPSLIKEEVDATIELLRDIDPDYRVVSFFQPFPGTPYWDHPEHFGLSEIAPLEEWNFHEVPICSTKYFNKNELENAAFRMYLDRGDAKGINPQTDAFLPVLNFEECLDEVPPLPVARTFSQFDGNITIAEILKFVTAEYGHRGKLITLYWLSAALRESMLKISSKKNSSTKPQLSQKVMAFPGV